MGNALRILKRDIKRLLKAPAAMIVVIALLVLPSLYTWYNVIAFWDPYGATGNLSVCVVNQDAGVKTDLTGEINVGEKLVEEMSGNDQLNWTFNDYDTAMDDLYAGRIYAVYVVPEDFSECLVSPLTGEIKSPHIEYYANEKLGPVSPKITDTAANALEQKINSAFVATVAESAADAVDDAVGEAGGALDTTKLKISTGLTAVETELGKVSDDLTALEKSIEDARSKVAAAGDAIAGSSALFDNARAIIRDVENEAEAFKATLKAISEKVKPGQSGIPQKLGEAAEKAAGVANGVADTARKAQADVELVVARLQPIATALQDVATELKKIADAYPRQDAIKKALEKAAQDAQTRADEAQAVVNGLQKAADDLGLVADAAATTAAELDKLSHTVPGSIIRFVEELYGAAASAVDSEIAQITAACEMIGASITSLESSVDQALPLIGQLDTVLVDCGKAIGQTNTLVGDIRNDIGSLKVDLGILGQGGVISDALANGTLNPQSISEFMGSPTELTTEKLYPLNAYGSGMAPLFLNLTFWIGAFMLVIIFRLEVDSEGIPDLKPSQRYLGRFFLFAIFAVIQSAICCAGTLFLGVQAANVPALFVAAALTALAFLSLIYALSSMFKHVGKALCIVLVFAQIPGASGLYPIELTSDFFRAIYPYLPFSYGINAMRESIGGFYGGYYAHDLFILALILFGCLIVGMLVTPIMSNVIRMAAREIRSGDLYNGEEAITPERPYRTTQVLRALTEREQYRDEVQRSYERFSRRYPLFIRASIIVGVGVPVLLSLLFALDAAEKVTLLTLFLLWLILLIAFLVIVESRRYSFERQLNLNTMSEDRLLNIFAHRNRFVRSGLRLTSRGKVADGGLGEGESDAANVEAQEASDLQEEEGASYARRRAGGGLHNIGLIIRHDVSGLFKNVTCVAITVGLIVLPSLFAWYNILACWNVFDNTGNLSVAVASQDEGYESDLLPINVNVGEKVLSALHENDRINWVFTNADDAIEGTKAGTYYAALVLPKDFSKSLLTFYDNDAGSAKIDYYVNEKVNAIAPNITGIGADTVSYEVNAAFADTLSEVAAGVAKSLSNIAQNGDLGGLVASVTSGMRDLADRVNESGDALSLYALVTKDTQSLLQASATALSGLQAKVQAASADIDAAKQKLNELIASAESSIKDIEGMLDKAKTAVGELEKKVDELVSKAGTDVAAISADLRAKADDIDAKAAKVQELIDELKKLRDDLHSGVTKEIGENYSGGYPLVIDTTIPHELTVMIEDTVVIDQLIAVLTKVHDAMAEASAACRKVADALDTGTADVRQALDDLKKLQAQMQSDMDAVKAQIKADLGPGIDKLKADIAALSASVDQTVAQLGAAASELPATLNTVADALGDAIGKINGANDKLHAVSNRLQTLANSIDTALLSGDLDTVKAILQGDPAELATALSAPVQVERTALFPCANFGSAMTPLYCALAIFIGSLLIMVAMRPEVSRRGREQLCNPKPRQLYIGHFGAVAIVSLAQTTLLALGCMFFLKVPLLFMVCFWLSGLVLAFIVYTLVAVFGNLGKGLAVLLLIVQVTACNGSYPLPLLPDFISAISPWVPATYIVEALRSAMMGVYMNDFWIAIGHLLLFVVPFLVLGLVFRRPLNRFMKIYVSKVEECKIME